MASDFERFLTDFVAAALQKVEQGFIAEIVSFDKETMRATIKPLLKFVSEEDGEDSPVDLETTNIENVPVQHINAGSAYIRPNYVNGDKVNVKVCSSPISQPIDSSLSADIAINRFSLDSCVIIGGVVPENFSPPQSWSDRDGLLIGNDDAFIEVLADSISIEKGTNIITVGESSIDISGDVNINGILTIGDTVGQQTVIEDGEVTADTEVSAGLTGIGLTTHTHPYTDTPAGAATTQAPTPGS